MAKKKNKKNYEDKTPASVEFVRQIVDEAVDSILTGMQKIHDDDKKRFEKIEKGQKKLEKSQKQNNQGISELKDGQKELKDTINDTKLEYPSREEFDALKKKVFRHHPSN